MNGSGWVAAALLGACVACGGAFEPGTGSGDPADAGTEASGWDAPASPESGGEDAPAGHADGSHDAPVDEPVQTDAAEAGPGEASADVVTVDSCTPVACLPGQCGNASDSCGGTMTCPSCGTSPPNFCNGGTCTPIAAFSQCQQTAGCGSVAYADGGSQVCVELASCSMTVGWWICPRVTAPSCHQASPNTPDWLVCCTGAEDPSKANGCGC